MNVSDPRRVAHDVRQIALDAYAAGDQAMVREIVRGMHAAALGDPVMLQLLALSNDNAADERALLRYAALEVEQFDAGAFFNLGVVEQRAGMIARALLRYQQALRIDPRHQGALNNLSDLLRRRGRAAEAWQCITTFLDQGGDPSGLEIRIAKIADDCGEVSEARRWFVAGVKRSAADPAAVWEQAMQQLRDEDFAAGWRGYETRRVIFPHQALALVSYAAPEWDGNPLGAHSLLVHREQGLGDTIMFASCLRDLPDHKGPLHLAVQPPLARLFAANFPKAKVWASVSAPGFEHESHQPWRAVAGEIDLAVPFGSLPLHLRSNGFGPPYPYLAAVPEDEAAWGRRLLGLAPGSEAGLRAGLVISARREGGSGPGIAEGAPKSLPGILAHPLGLPGVTWFGLHDRTSVADLADLAGLGIVDTSEWLFDFADTAGLISQLDVVVAVDTAVAHLAGAMGKKVLLMLRRFADWRWGRLREDCLWYRDVEVFRQTHEGDWAPVVAKVATRMAELRDAKTADAYSLELEARG